MDARDRQVARETVRPRHECPACNPGAQPELPAEELDRLTRSTIWTRAAWRDAWWTAAGWPGAWDAVVQLVVQTHTPPRTAAALILGSRVVCPELRPAGLATEPPAGRDDLTPVDVTRLPPWGCCGGRGAHTDECPLYLPEGDRP